MSESNTEAGGADAPDPVEPPILVVDDEAGPRGLIAASLRRAGYVVLEADSGQAALDLVAIDPVALVIADVAMPGMSGIDLVRTLRSQPSTATLPIITITGSGDDRSVVDALDAGANDFLAKPMRLDELLARVRALLRTHAAWSRMVQHELRVRSGVVAALGELTVSNVPEEAAERVVAELARRILVDFVSVAQVSPDGQMQELATFNHRDGVRRGGETFPPDLAAYLVGRARDGPWVEDVKAFTDLPMTMALRVADADTVAAAPLFVDDALVGLLSIGSIQRVRRPAGRREARLLAAAIDYASVLEAVAGPAIAGRQDAARTRAQLDHILSEGQFHVVVQPIVTLEDEVIVGYEGLTRFDDGVRPDVRFAEATRAGLGPAYEFAAIQLALEASERLIPGAFISVNVSPHTLITRRTAIAEALKQQDRPIVIELTEHVPIDDYAAIREVIESMGDRVQLAVDDAGAGYASLRHILELRPAYAKLDISLVRGIDTDELRQALAAGLNYYGLRTGCRLIAEGVETRAEADTLAGLGIEFGQGYLFGRPAPA